MRGARIRETPGQRHTTRSPRRGEADELAGSELDDASHPLRRLARGSNARPMNAGPRREPARHEPERIRRLALALAGFVVAHGVEGAQHRLDEVLECVPGHLGVVVAAADEGDRLPDGLLELHVAQVEGRAVVLMLRAHACSFGCRPAGAGPSGCPSVRPPKGGRTDWTPDKGARSVRNGRIRTRTDGPDKPPMRRD